MKKSVSPEVYKQIKEECKIIASRMLYYRDNTEIQNDLDIFRHLALIGTLADAVYNKINE